MSTEYWTQMQAPAGNWCDVLGSNSLQSCLDHADFLTSKYDVTTRVIERTDVVVGLNLVSSTWFMQDRILTTMFVESFRQKNLQTRLLLNTTNVTTRSMTQQVCKK